VSIARYYNKNVSALTQEDILSPTVPTWGQIDLFQQNFAKLFVAYRDLLLSNSLAELRALRGQVSQFHDSDEFVKIHGPAPWDFVNETIRSAGMDFSINSPQLDAFSPFQPTLTKTSSKIVIPFSSLSSGEKILMSFAFCVYYSNDRRQLAIQPKVLLLDEIDAPLHPSMSRNIIDTITRTLVGSFGIKVIATTHSPSTVALAPEDSIYTMTKGSAGLTKSTKAAALNILTVGVPTIAVSYDGRRQVFVESQTDAEVYSKLFHLLKPKLNSERSLEFIATGKRTAGKGDEDNGCDKVRQIVDSLSNSGNLSVFGLLDWDGKNKPTERISVLANGLRNGIENVLFDPLLIAMVTYKNCPTSISEINGNDVSSYLEFTSSSHEILQKAVKEVGLKVFQNEPEKTFKSKYVGGLELDIDCRFAETDDHTLEELILERLPFLRSVTKNQDGNFLKHMATSILPDKVEFTPIEIRDVFMELLDRPAHAAKS
jgi:hypothetical protein